MNTLTNSTSATDAAIIIKQDQNTLTASQEEHLLKNYQMPPHNSYAAEATGITYIQLGNDGEGKIIAAPDKVILPEREDWAKNLKPHS
jgi:hypothetical protein